MRANRHGGSAAARVAMATRWRGPQKQNSSNEIIKECHIGTQRHMNAAVAERHVNETGPRREVVVRQRVFIDSIAARRQTYML